MTPRPTVVKYAEISTIMQKSLHSALLGKTTTASALSDAAAQISALK